MSEIRNSSEKYGAFLKDLHAREPKILPDDEIRSRITQMRNPELDIKQKEVLRGEVLDSVFRLIPYAISNSRSPQANKPEELIGEAFETVNSCIDNFNPDYVNPETEEKAKFSTYVASSLEKKLRTPRTAEVDGQIVHLTQRSENYALYMRRAWEEFLQTHQRQPNPEEWYKATVSYIGERTRNIQVLEGITPEMFDSVRLVSVEKKSVRIGQNVGGGGVHSDTLSPAEGNIAETLSDPSDSVFELVSKDLLKYDIQEALQLLEPTRRIVLELRFGIGLNESGKERQELTLEQVAEMLELSVERIRQIESKALRQLRDPRITRKLADYLNGDSPSSSAEAYNKEKEKDFLERYNAAILYIANSLIFAKRPKDVKKRLERFREAGTPYGAHGYAALKRLGVDVPLEYVEFFDHYGSEKLSDDIVNAINESIKNRSANTSRTGRFWYDAEELTLSSK